MSRAMQQPFEFAEPRDIIEALQLAKIPGAQLFAGGCELVSAMRQGNSRFTRLVSIMRLPGLDTFRAHPKIGLEFAAQVLIRRLLADIWVSKRWAALHEAMEQIRPLHTANMGTVIGNICAASEYYDLSVALTAHRAVLRIHDGHTERELPIDAFYEAPGKTVLTPGEMVSSIFAPAPAADAGSAFRKIATRSNNERAPVKIGIAAYIALDAERENIFDAVLAIGGLGKMPRRLPRAEASLKEVVADTQSYIRTASIVLEELDLPQDQGHSVDIISDWVRVLARDVLEQAASRARSRHDPAEDAHLAY